MKNELKVTITSVLFGNIAAVAVLLILSNWLIKIKPEFGPFIWIPYVITALYLLYIDISEIRKCISDNR